MKRETAWWLDAASISTACRKLDGHHIMSRYPNGIGRPPADLYNEEIVKELEEPLERITVFAREHM